jgi:hypothetical protein
VTTIHALNHPSTWPPPGPDRRAAFAQALLELFVAVEQEVPELDWTLDVPKLAIYSRSARVEGHPDRTEAPFWQVVPLERGWGAVGTPARNARWTEWQHAVAKLQPWMNTTEHIAALVRRIQDRAVAERERA